MKMSFRSVLCAGLLLASSTQVYAQLNVDPAQPDTFGVNLGRISELSSAVTAGTFKEVHSLLILRHGALVHESYYEGNTDYFDDNLNRVSPGTVEWDETMPHYVASITKSITSAIVGIALDEFGIPVSAVVHNLVPAYSNLFAQRTIEASINVEHLLTMTGGHAWDEWGTDDLTQMWRSGQDFIAFALNQEMAHSPGSFWRYNSGEANILMGIVDALSGNAATYIQQRLFDPLEIQDYDWRTQPGGLPEAAARLDMRPRDLAKIGELFLNRGKWNNVQLIPEAWIDASLSAQVSTGSLTAWDYGYLWWAKSITFTRDGTQITLPYFAAEGDGGNLIAIFPQLDLAVIITQGNYSNFGTYDTQNHRILADYILPSVTAVAQGTGAATIEMPEQSDLMIEVFPNPAQKVATIEYSPVSQESVTIELFDSFGRRVIAQNDSNISMGLHRVNIGTENLASGMYYVRLSQASNVSTTKLLVLHQ